MQDKSYPIPVNTITSVGEPVVAYQKDSSFDHWNPNVPFNGTQEEWWEHFHCIENSQFYPVSEIHQRISLWLDNQKK